MEGRDEGIKEGGKSITKGKYIPFFFNELVI